MRRVMNRNLRTRLVSICALASMTFLAACSSSDDKGVAGGASGDAGIVAIKDLDVAGVAQKGPFIKGSSVTVQGMDCKTLKFTDEFFEGTVKSDKGDFTFDDVTLSSTCALFEVTGYYLNEVTGEKSSEKLTLRTLTNLKDRNSVNVNVLTSLEYGRVMNLVAGKETSFADAKKQAEKEVLAAFDVEGVSSKFEDLNVFEKGNDGAALLAVSVMVLANVNDAEISERLEEYSTAIAKNGSLDKGSKAEMVDWATSAAANGTLDSIRKNIESWGYADEVPAFESIISAVKSSSDDSTGSSTGASDSTRDSYLNPKIKYDSIVDSRDGQVYKTVKIGNQLWMAQNLNYADSVKTPSLKGKSWCYKDSSEYCDKYGRLYTWTAAMDSVALATDSLNPRDCGVHADNSYCRLGDDVFQGICPDGWHLPRKEEWEILIAETGDSSSAGKALKATSGWNDFKDESGNGDDVYGFSALPSGSWNSYNKDFSDVGDYAYFWSSYSGGVTSAYGMGLLHKMDEALMGSDNISGGQAVRCIKGAASISAGTLTDERDGQTYKTLKIGNQIWMAENLNYAYKSSDGLDSSSFCYNDSLEYCEKYGRLYTWAAAVDSLALFSQNCMGCGYESSYSSFNNVVRGVCPDGWHLPTSTEWGTLYESVGEIPSVIQAKGYEKWSNATNIYSFSAIPAGNRYVGNYQSLDVAAAFWSSTEESLDNPVGNVTKNSYAFTVTSDEVNQKSAFYKHYALSVRCVKD